MRVGRSRFRVSNVGGPFAESRVVIVVFWGALFVETPISRSWALGFGV